MWLKSIIFFKFTVIKLDIITKILELDFEKYETFIHCTTYDRALEIMSKGFVFNEYLENSADRVTDNWHMNFCINNRKRYGDTVVVIQIEKNYFDKLNSYDGYWAEQVTDKSLIEELNNEDYEFEYSIPPSMIKGYICKNELVKNPIFGI